MCFVSFALEHRLQLLSVQHWLENVAYALDVRLFGKRFRDMRLQVLLQCLLDAPECRLDVVLRRIAHIVLPNLSQFVPHGVNQWRGATGNRRMGSLRSLQPTRPNTYLLAHELVL